MVRFDIVNNIVLYDNDEIMAESRTVHSTKTINAARKYCRTLALDGKSWNIVKVIDGKRTYMGMVLYSSYSKNGKTAFAWFYSAHRGRTYFLNVDGSLGRRKTRW